LNRPEKADLPAGREVINIKGLERVLLEFYPVLMVS
jgi:hypothetical protein